MSLILRTCSLCVIGTETDSRAPELPRSVYDKLLEAEQLGRDGPGAAQVVSRGGSLEEGRRTWALGSLQRDTKVHVLVAARAELEGRG